MLTTRLSNECKQSYCYIKTDQSRHHFPPALSVGDEPCEKSQDPINNTGEDQVLQTHVEEDDKFARVHSLRQASKPAETSLVDSEPSSDEDPSPTPPDPPERDQEEPIMGTDSKPSLNDSALSLSTPPSPKQVRFAPHSEALVSRPLTSQEAWALYHLETHARGCDMCSDYANCIIGHDLLQDVHNLVCLHAGEMCSTTPSSEGKWTRVEIPSGYDRTKAIIGVKRKSGRKRPPVISYDTHPRPSRKKESEDNTYVEPAKSHRDNERRSRHKPELYEVVKITPSSQYKSGDPIRLPERTKRGSLYESDMRRPRREYRIQRKTPERRGESQDRERKEREREERRKRRRSERELREGGR